ncbi:hypothetical protein, partial [Dysosmobacter sp.]|uniref:hypothetical protein n=1 Tax=Dysosmobacter sp. TaxID=2591382 RepID=UPI00307F382B
RGNSAAAVLCVWEEALSALKTDEKAAKIFLTVEERNQKPARKGWLSACRKSLFDTLSKFSELYKCSENLGF